MRCRVVGRLARLEQTVLPVEAAHQHQAAFGLRSESATLPGDLETRGPVRGDLDWELSGERDDVIPCRQGAGSNGSAARDASRPLPIGDLENQFLLLMIE